mgnify:CR=1 FL=1
MYLGYVSIRGKNYTLTKCFEQEPEIRHKFNTLWENIAAFETFISIRDPTDDECYKAAELWEDWCRVYPVFFPTKGLTRKMTEYSLVFPRFIREKKGMVNKMFRLEQEGSTYTRCSTLLKGCSNLSGINP